jgi:hypothetical protein
MLSDTMERKRVLEQAVALNGNLAAAAVARWMLQST